MAGIIKRLRNGEDIDGAGGLAHQLLGFGWVTQEFYAQENQLQCSGKGGGSFANDMSLSSAYEYAVNL